LDQAHDPYLNFSKVVTYWPPGIGRAVFHLCFFWSSPAIVADDVLFWRYSAPVTEPTAAKRIFAAPRKAGPRAEYRQQEKERVSQSGSLAEKFPQLKSLKVELIYGAATTGGWSNGIKYDVNLAHAKSVFRFDCANAQCVAGDFDLSEELAKAVQARRATVSGEMCCQGWSSRETISTVRCHNILRYKFSLKY